MSNLKHEFSIYVKNASEIINVSSKMFITITDKAFCHRVSSVLRIQPEDYIIIFDRKMHMRLLVKHIEKNKVIAHINERRSNIYFTPKLTVWLPLLKKDDLEYAIYEVTAAGATEIQLVATKKTKKSLVDDYAFERLGRIIEAAAEQSTCYHFALLKKPQSITYLIEQEKNNFRDPVQKSYIVADPSGEHMPLVMNAVRQEKKEEVIVLIGPEGDLTSEEKQLLKQLPFYFCKLTPTILRAHQAASVMVSIIRSFV